MTIKFSEFPFKEIRPKQKAILESINSTDKKYIIIEAETGVGKSAIATTLCRSYNKGFIITSTKQLQKQYVDDFGTKSLTSIKGKANYKCFHNPNLNCESGLCNIDKKIYAECRRERLCEYYNIRDRACASNIFLTSYQYFLRAIDCAEWIMPRNVLVFDECHLFEDQVVQWAQINLSKEYLNEKYEIFVNAGLEECVVLADEPNETGWTKRNQEWVMSILKLIEARRIDKFEEVKLLLGDTFGELKDMDALTDEQLDMISGEHKEYYELDKFYRKLKVFLKSDINKWLIDPIKGGLVLTPLDITDIFKNMINNMAVDKIVFMSATILDINGFINVLGLQKEDVHVIRANSDFDPNKSPIVFQPTCKMNYQALQDKENLEKIKNKIIEILANHPNEKGIIHTGNQLISKYIMDNIFDERLLIRLDDITNMDIIRQHQNSKNSTVLVSSSLSEGVDLRGDLSRFQIIVKLPFLSLGDQRIKIKSQQGDWYLCQMFRKFVQQCGRSTRDSEDYSITYVLDSTFKYWYGKTKGKKWFSKKFMLRIIKK